MCMAVTGAGTAQSRARFSCTRTLPRSASLDGAPTPAQPYGRHMSGFARASRAKRPGGFQNEKPRSLARFSGGT